MARSITQLSGLIAGLVVGLLPLVATAAGPQCRVDRQAVLPVVMNGYMPTVEVTLNGKRVKLGVDTGSQGTVLTPAIVDQLGLNRDTRRFTTAIGNGNRRLVSNAVPDSFEFAGVTYQDRSVAVVDIGQPPGPMVGAGGAMAGLIGADFLSLYDIDLDIPHRRLTLYRVNHCPGLTPLWPGRFTSVKMSLGHARRPTIPVELDGVPLQAIFDTGASQMILSKASVIRLGAGGAAHYYSAERLRVGDEVFGGARAILQDLPVGDAEMLIGEDYMLTRRFWLSYATGTLFIQPNT